MVYTQRPSEVMVPLAVMHADSYSGVQDSGYVSLALYHRAWIVLDVGDMAVGATLDIDVEEATTTAGIDGKNITGKSITQLTQAGGDGDDLICISIRTEELDVANMFDCINVEVTGAGAATEYSLIIYGCEPRFPPVPVTAWQERVA